jgi:hypothetical protein
MCQAVFKAAQPLSAALPVWLIFSMDEQIVYGAETSLVIASSRLVLGRHGVPERRADLSRTGSLDATMIGIPGLVRSMAREAWSTSTPSIEVSMMATSTPSASIVSRFRYTVLAISVLIRC